MMTRRITCFAAPWAHWRIFRHRVASRAPVEPGAPGSDDPERFPVEEIYRFRSREFVHPRLLRQEGFAHLAWIYFQDPLGGAAWPVGLVIMALLVSAVHLSRRGLDPHRA